MGALRQHSIISPWSHGELKVGQEKQRTITETLEKSDIILLLITPSFISSDYLYTDQLSIALEMHRTSRALLIPIHLKPCYYSGTPIAEIQGFPEEKSVFEYENPDVAMSALVGKLAKTIEKMPVKKALVNHVDSYNSSSDSLSILSDKFLYWLNDTEVVLKNRYVENVILDDIFVYPDLKSLGKDSDKYNEQSVKTIVENGGHYLILGEEQAGKTATAKSIFKYSITLGYFPVFVDAAYLRSSDLDKILSDAISEQYLDETIDNSSLRNRGILILDNLSATVLNNNSLNLLLENIQGHFDTCIIFASDNYQYVVPDIDGLSAFELKEILPFGHKKREALISNWVTMGRTATMSDQERYTIIDSLESKIDSLVRRTVVPPKPIYLLSLIQMFEAYNPQKIDLTSFGHCYQHLVYQALEKSEIPANDIEKFFNVMTEFAWSQFKAQGEISFEELPKFFDNYSNKFLGVDREQVLDKLLRCSIFSKNEVGYKFKYPYIYYFFVAKYISENYKKAYEAKEGFYFLLKNLHKEDCANIIIFLTHHTKDDWILDEIQICLMELFEEYSPETLDKNNLSFMSSFMEDIPELVMEKRKVETEREKRAEELDAIERKHEQFDNHINNLEPSDTLAKVNKAFKGIEIIGQIVKNRYSSLQRDTLRNIVGEGYNTGLRFLSYFLSLSEFSKGEVVKIIEHVLKENPRISDADLEKEAKATFLLLTYGVIFGVIRKISASMGGAEIEEICLELEKATKSPAVMLINQSMQLNNNKKLDFKRIDSLQKEFRSNPTCGRILRENIVQHTYMFPVTYQDKQKLSSALNISMQQQRKNDRSSGGKILPAKRS